MFDIHTEKYFSKEPEHSNDLPQAVLISRIALLVSQRELSYPLKSSYL